MGILVEKMIKTLLELFMLVILLSASSQQKANPFNGTCPSFDNCYDKEYDFNHKDFLGIWFMAANIPFPFQEQQRCTFVNVLSTSSPIRQTFTTYEISEKTNKKRVISGETLLSPPNNINITYSALELPNHFQAIKWTCDFWIMVACYECGFYTKEAAGIRVDVFTRDQFPSQTIVDAYKAALVKCGIPGSSLHPQNQNNCSFWSSTE